MRYNQFFKFVYKQIINCYRISNFVNTMLYSKSDMNVINL